MAIFAYFVLSFASAWAMLQAVSAAAACHKAGLRKTAIFGWVAIGCIAYKHFSG